MDLLRFGLENRRSRSRLKKWLAGGLLELEKRRADCYEARLNRKKIAVPDSPEETETMLRSIWERIESGTGAREELSPGSKERL